MLRFDWLVPDLFAFFVRFWHLLCTGLLYGGGLPITVCIKLNTLFLLRNIIMDCVFLVHAETVGQATMSGIIPVTMATGMLET